MARSLPKTNTSFHALWIGLMEFNRTFEWNWLDGSVVDFLKWARSMPKLAMYHPIIDQETPSCTILVVDTDKTTTVQSFVLGVNWWFDLYYDLTSFWVDPDLIRQSCYSLFSGAICQKNSTNIISTENNGNFNNNSSNCDFLEIIFLFQISNVMKDGPVMS
jgi:hypothetical protein